MGCRISKPENSASPVIVIRERRDLIHAAVNQRRLLTSAHVSYFQSLSRVSDALVEFVRQADGVLTLPPITDLGIKPGSVKENKDSGHLEISDFDSDSDSLFYSSCASLIDGITPGSNKDVDSGHLDISDCSSSESIIEDIDEIEEIVEEINYMPNYHYMTGTSIPNIVYQQPTLINHANQVYTNNGYSSYNYPIYGFNLNYNYDYKLNSEPILMQELDEKRDYESVPVRVPSSPVPEVSGWEFLNPFDSYQQFIENYYVSLPSGSNGSRSGSVRSCLDLEDEKTEQEFIKGKKQRKYLNTETGHGGCNKGENMEIISDDNKGVKNIKKLRKVSSQIKQRISNEAGQTGHKGLKERKLKNTEMGQMGHEGLKMVSFEMSESLNEDKVIIESMKKVKNVSFEMIELLNEDSFRESDISETNIRGLKEVVKEVKYEFDNLIFCENEVARLLEVGTVQKNSRIRVLKWAFSRILGIFLPSISSGDSNENYMDLNEIEFNKFSCILDRLYLWEKKLYKEVKEEDKLRIKHEKKSNQLNSLIKKGADGKKIHATQMVTQDLATKIDVSIRKMEFISIRIHKVRDEELQPLLAEMLEGFKKMWRFIFECHHKQFKLILKSKPDKFFKPETRLINPNSFNNNVNNDNNPTKKLETELLKWSLNFKNWTKAQNSYIQTLNHYFIKWLNEEDESETIDIFTSLQDWAHVSERMSENGEMVINAINSFAFNVHENIKGEYLMKDLGTIFKALEVYSSENLRCFDEVRILVDKIS